MTNSWNSPCFRSRMAICLALTVCGSRSNAFAPVGNSRRHRASNSELDAAHAFGFGEGSETVAPRSRPLRSQERRRQRRPGIGTKSRTQDFTQLHVLPKSSGETGGGQGTRPASKARKPGTKRQGAFHPERNATPFSEGKSLRKHARQSDPSVFQRDVLLDHAILTKEEEFELGGKVKRAQELRSAMGALVVDKKIALQEELARENRNQDAAFAGEVSNEALLMAQSDGGYLLDLDDMNHISIVSDEDSLCSIDSGFEHSNVKDAFEPIDDCDHRLLSDDDIMHGLELSGGREQLRQILLQGALARDRLIRSNVRLVVSIAKRWAQQSAKADGDSNSRLVGIYAGTTNRPSLDDAIQEGVLGLARAADKYDPSRGLRFSTYATHWVKNYVRICYQDAATGCLYVPIGLHEVKSKYNKILMSYYSRQEAIPSEEALAKEVGVSVSRLRSALTSTRPLVSIDGPAASGSGMKGSRAGGDSTGDPDLQLKDVLPCTDPRPDDLLELSFLRQCLENAMAAELSPHERDILRLRLGLDDGVTRSAREVTKVCGGNLSISQVRSAEQRAYRKLRSPYSLRNYKLLAYLDFASVDYSSMKYGC